MEIQCINLKPARSGAKQAHKPVMLRHALPSRSAHLDVALLGQVQVALVFALYNGPSLWSSVDTREMCVGSEYKLRSSLP